MSLDAAVAGLSRPVMVEAIYRASRMITEKANEPLEDANLSAEQRRQVAEAVADIVVEIEQASNFQIADLPAEKRAQVLSELYHYLSGHIVSRVSKKEGKALLAELHGRD